MFLETLLTVVLLEILLDAFEEDEESLTPGI